MLSTKSFFLSFLSENISVRVVKEAALRSAGAIRVRAASPRCSAMVQTPPNVHPSFACFATLVPLCSKKSGFPGDLGGGGGAGGGVVGAGEEMCLGCWAKAPLRSNAPPPPPSTHVILRD